MSKQILLEDLPLRRFHLRVAFSGTGGQFSDGFVLGIIGIAVSMASASLHLTPLWMGLLGAAPSSLALSISQRWHWRSLLIRDSGRQGP